MVKRNNRVIAVSNTINRILDVMDLVLGGFLAVLVLGMTALISVQVLGRYVFGFSFPWIPDGLRFASAGLTFIGAAYLVRGGEHVGISFVRNMVSRRMRQVMMLFGNGLIIIFLVWVISQGRVLAERHLNVEAAAFFQIPLYYPYLLLPIGLSVTLIYYILTTALVLLGTSELLEESEL